MTGLSRADLAHPSQQTHTQGSPPRSESLLASPPLLSPLHLSLGPWPPPGRLHKPTHLPAPLPCVGLFSLNRDLGNRSVGKVPFSLFVLTYVFCFVQFYFVWM